MNQLCEDRYESKRIGGMVMIGEEANARNDQNRDWFIIQFSIYLFIYYYSFIILLSLLSLGLYIN